jgi:mono/diheme cytochrome c family protein
MRGWLLIWLFIAVVISACLQQEQGAPATPVPTAIESISKIETLFAVCEGCHGSEGSGGIGIAPALRDNKWVKRADLEEIKKVIRDGRGYGDKRYAEYASTMPSWKETYSDGEIGVLAGYVKSLSP